MSHILEEDVSEADILRLALDGHLTLSIDFVNKARARIGQVVPIEQASVREFTGLDGALLRMYEGEQIDDKGVLECNKNIITIDGVWDFWLIGDARCAIEHEYQQLTGGPAVELLTLGGFVVVYNPDCNQYAWLQESFEDNPYQPGSRAYEKDLEQEIDRRTWANNIDANEVQSLREKYKGQRKKYLERRKGQPEENDYYPTAELPENARLVVRTAVLREFEAQAARAASGISYREGEEHVSRWLALLNQGAQQWWSTADRTDSRTHPTNADVSNWLQERGMSQTMADAAARIIRPVWATNGRRPE